jgi:multiple sugar transport system ATP-binding protein
MMTGDEEAWRTPNELYSNPSSLFVTGFIGSPAINYLPPRWNGTGLQLRLCCATGRVFWSESAVRWLLMAR